MKKIILTKKRIKRLELALTIDDILYEKFKRLNEQLNRDYEKFRQMQTVVEVVKQGQHYKERMQIIKEVKTSHGIYLEVR